MNCPAEDQWDLLSMGAVAAEPLNRHAEECGPCRVRRAEAARRHADLSRAHGVFLNGHGEQRAALLARIGDDARVAAATPRWRIRRLIPTLAAAAAVAIAAVVFLFPSRGGVALAQVVQALEEVRSVAVTMSITRSQDGNIRGQAIKRIVQVAGVGLREDHYGANGQPFSTDFVLPEQGLFITLLHGSREYTLNAMTPDQQGSMATETSPSVWLMRLMNLTEPGEVRRLGPSVVAGRQVEGFERDWNPSGSGQSQGALRLWIDVQTLHPALLEAEAIWPATGTRLVELYQDFEWNAAVDPALLEPVIPEGYTEREPLN